MREIDKYGIYKEKLQGVCDENELTYVIQNNKYPFLMTIKPLSGMDAQQTMLDGMEDNESTGYISPDATLVFAYKDGQLTYKISETFTISDALFSKLKNLFKNLHAMWMQHFYRDWIERHSQSAVCENTDCEQAEPTTEEETAEDLGDTEYSCDGDLYAAPTEDDTDDLSEFFGEDAPTEDTPYYIDGE